MTDLRCDVAVVGAGLAGLLAADRLARAGADVILIQRPSAVPVAATSKSLGVVALGWIDSPARLAAALGEPVARGLVAWSAAACASLRRTVDSLGLDWQPTGSRRIAMDPADATAWEQSVELLQRWGIGGGVRALATDEVDALGPGSGFLGGAFVPSDGVIDVTALRVALEERFSGRQVVATVAVEAGSGAPVLVADDGRRITAELVVAAPGAQAPSLHPFFGSCIYPVRVQAQWTRPGLAPPTLDAPLIARHRFETALARPDGSVQFAGCRWADQPEMGAGETDDQVLSDRVSDRQDAWLRDNLGIEPGPVTRWAGIVAYTCDGLPIIGPLPGAPRVIAAVGWSGWGLSLAPRAVDEICAAILGEEPPDGVETPALLTARRLV